MRRAAAVKSTDLSTLLFRYLDIQKANGREYSQSWQQQHSADELKAISKAVNLLSEKGIYTLEELDAALSIVHDKASEIRSGMKPREAHPSASKAHRTGAEHAGRRSPSTMNTSKSAGRASRKSLPKHTAPISQYGMQLTAICGQICRT